MVAEHGNQWPRVERGLVVACGHCGDQIPREDGSSVVFEDGRAFFNAGSVLKICFEKGKFVLKVHILRIHMPF